MNDTWDRPRWGKEKLIGKGWRCKEDSNRHKLFKAPTGELYTSKITAIDAGFDPSVASGQTGLNFF